MTWATRMFQKGASNGIYFANEIFFFFETADMTIQFAHALCVTQFIIQF